MTDSLFDYLRYALSRLFAQRRTADIPDPEWEAFWEERAKRPLHEYRFHDRGNGGC
jgi:hypothetical protein